MVHTICAPSARASYRSHALDCDRVHRLYAARRIEERLDRRRRAWITGEPFGKSNKARLITLLRLRELERLFRRRYGFTLPDDDAGLDDLEIAAHHVAFLRGEVEYHIVAWASVWCPWMAEAEAKALAMRVAGSPRKFTAATLGLRLRLTETERVELAITTIRAFDVTPEAMAERRKRRDREYQAARRRQSYTAAPPLSRTKPWEGVGISRRTWYRRKKASGTKSVGSRVESNGADGISANRTTRGKAAKKVPVQEEKPEGQRSIHLQKRAAGPQSGRDLGRASAAGAAKRASALAACATALLPTNAPASPPVFS